MSTTTTGKRKAETELHSPEQVGALIAGWTPEQLVKVLGQLGAEHDTVLQAIHRENQNDPKLRKIFVRNLPYTVTNTMVREFFLKYGNVVEAVIIMDKNTGTSKGFGFVTFETVEAATASLQETTKDLDGRPIYVNLAAKKDGISSSVSSLGGSARKDGAGEDTTLRKLFVWSLSYETTSTQLHEYFSSFGEVVEAIVLTNRDTGTSKGYGFVTMATAEAAALALIEPVKQFAGRSIHVKLAAANDGKAGSGVASTPVATGYASYPAVAYPGYAGYYGYPTAAYPQSATAQPTQHYPYPTTAAAAAATAAAAQAYQTSTPAQPTQQQQYQTSTSTPYGWQTTTAQ